VARAVLADDHVALRDYYLAVRPFYAAEMGLRADVPEWLDLARRARAHTVLDLGCGGGRVGAAIAADDPSRSVVGVDLLDVLVAHPPPIPFVRGDMRALPFGPRFELVVAANDPFAHLLDDGSRGTALREACRVLAAGGRIVIDGLFVRERGEFRRTSDLGDGTTRIEDWRETADGVYETRYTYRRSDATLAQAHARVRSWRADEVAVRETGACISGGLDGRPFDPGSDRIVISLGGGPA
jgi:SAM-dependent methyltransferase